VKVFEIDLLARSSPTYDGVRAFHGVNMQDPEEAEVGELWRAVVADDDALARRTINQVLRQAGIVVVAEAADGREAVDLVRYYDPDLVLMDVVMPELDGILATRRILKQLPDQLIIVLTGTADEEDELGLQAIRAGAAGYLSKDVDIEALPRALEAVSRGEAAISRQMTRRLIERIRQAPNGPIDMRPVKSPLTSREWEVIVLLEGRMSTEAIADQLVLSTETVRSHVKNILRKLEVRSREDAVAAVKRMREAPLADDDAV
jgi:DNA-binding NarL/FixJ family response regulator